MGSGLRPPPWAEAFTKTFTKTFAVEKAGFPDLRDEVAPNIEN